MRPLNALIYVEDPGAALFVQALPAALRKDGLTVEVAAGPFAAPYFPDGCQSAPTGAAEAGELLDRFAPDVIVVGTSENPRSGAFPLIDLARSRGIPVIGAVDSYPNIDHRFRGEGNHPLAHAPDWLLVPDQRTADGYAEIGFPAANIRVCGHPRLDEIARVRRRWTPADRVAQRQRWFPQVPAGRPIVLFVSELSVGLGHAPFRRDAGYRLTGTTDTDARSEIVMEELLLTARHLPVDPYLVLRLHPKQRLSDERHNAVHFDAVSQAEPALEVVNAADLVVGMTSILLVEAATLGRPVLSIVPRPEEQLWLGDVGAEIPCVCTRPQIEAHLALGADTGRWPAVTLHDGDGDAVGVMARLVLERVGQAVA